MCVLTSKPTRLAKASDPSTFHDENITTKSVGKSYTSEIRVKGEPTMNRRPFAESETAHGI